MDDLVTGWRTVMNTWGRRAELRGLLGIVAGFMILLIPNASAHGQQPFEVLHALVNPGDAPQAPLIRGSDGALYGTTTGGGAGFTGTIFKLTLAGVLTILHSFAADCHDGCQPIGNLIQAANGNFYGTTTVGGAGGKGTVFSITPAGELTTLHAFASDCSEGCFFGLGFNLLQAGDGTLYGTRLSGGSDGQGTIFRIAPGGAFTTLHSFRADCADGCSPFGGLIQGTDGDFYGTTLSGGTGSSGTVFRITTSGVLTVVHAFALDCADGCYPEGTLIQAKDGNLYGTTQFRAPDFKGSIFQLTTAGVLTTLHSFAADCSEGCDYFSRLIQASDGNLYGTSDGRVDLDPPAPNVCGTVFRISTTGTFRTLHSFPDSADGCYPIGGVVQGGDDYLYGATLTGGPGSEGTVFRTSTDGTFSRFHSFVTDCVEGCSPSGRLIEGNAGTVYGPMARGTVSGGGLIFSMATNGGPIVTLHSFDCSDGCFPFGDLARTLDGTFYGLMSGLKIFKLTQAGTLSTVYSFPDSCSIFGGCLGDLTLASDSKLYGVRQQRIALPLSDEFIFGISIDGGAPSILHSFDPGCSGGCGVLGALVQARDSNLYGAASRGGANGSGTIFGMTIGGSFTTIHSLAANCTEGCGPGGLILAGDGGSMYGTTASGSTNGQGTMFRVTIDGTLTTLHSFAGDCNEGCGARKLTLGSDGNIYGTAESGGVNGRGSIFMMTTAGILTTLHSFAADCSEGCYPNGVIRATNGNLYGTTYSGGPLGGGVIFRLGTAPPPPPQSITVTTPAPPSATYNTSFGVAATASSGLPVAITTTGGCGGGGTESATITMTSGTTECVVHYNQAGNGSYGPAPEKVDTTGAQRVPQSIAVTVAAPTSAKYGTSFDVAATASSGLTVAITTTGGCSGTGSGSATVMMTSGVTACVVHYNQAGDGNYTPASEKSSNTTAQRAEPTITVTTSAPATAVYHATFGVAATADSGLPVAITGTGACSGGGNGSATITMNSGTGTCTVRYTQAGGVNNLAAPPKTEATLAQKAGQSITVTVPAPGAAVYHATFTVAAIASSGLPVTITATDGCSGGGNSNGTAVRITMTTAVGACTVHFNRVANANYGPATEITSATTAQPAPQSIAVKKPAPVSASFNAGFGVAATASSGLPVAVTTTGVCTGGGSSNGNQVVITMTSASGTCTVHYNQAGNGNYLAAGEVSSDTGAQPAAQRITVTTAGPGSATYQSSFSVAATATSGLAVAITASGVCAGDGSGSAVVMMTAGTGTCTVTFNQGGDASYLAAAQKMRTIAARKASQSISITTPAPTSASFNASFGVAATSSSSLPVAITATGACSVTSGGMDSATITMSAHPGACTTRYNQLGNVDYAGAPAKVQVTTATAN